MNRIIYVIKRELLENGGLSQVADAITAAPPKEHKARDDANMDDQGQCACMGVSDFVAVAEGNGVEAGAVRGEGDDRGIGHAIAVAEVNLGQVGAVGGEGNDRGVDR